MKTKSTTTPRAGLALAGLLAFTLTADAKKPVPPPPEPPPAAAYDVVLLGDPGTASIAAGINEDGLVPVMIYPPDNSDHLAMVVPEEDNGTLVWRKDDDQDGCNDLLRELGIPPGVPSELAWTVFPWKINDHGVILVFGQRLSTNSHPDSAWVLAPEVVDGRLSWSDLDADGVNWQMASLPIEVIGEPQLVLKGDLPGDINNHGEVVLNTGSRGYLLVPNLYAVTPGGAVTVEYPAADLDGDGLNDYLIDLGAGVPLEDGSMPPLLPTVINDRGDIAGTVRGDSGDLPFIIRPRQDENGGLVWHEDEDDDGVNDLAVYLPLPSRAGGPFIWDMNENGTIVGSVQDSRVLWRAAIWQVDWETGTATATKLGTVDRKYDWSVAVGVNAGNQVLGHDSKNNWPDYPVNSEKLWLFEQGEMTPVGDLVPSGTGFAEGESLPRSINDSGMIVGSWRPVVNSGDKAFIMILAAGQ